MRLGFHYHIPALSTGKEILLPAYLGRFIDSLASNLEQLQLFLHTPRLDEIGLMDYPIERKNIKLIPLGPHSSIPSRMIHSRWITTQLRDHKNELDALLIRGPSPMLPAIAQAAGDLPLALLIVGDYLAGVDELPQPRWRKEAIRVWSWWNAHEQMKVARRSLTFVNSRKLYNELLPTVPNLVETRTTTLMSGDIYTRYDTCQSPPYHILYTGRLDRSKGILDLVDAVEILLKEGEDLILDLVGLQDKGDDVLGEVIKKTTSKGIESRVHYHGYHTIGPDLFKFYINSDIFVLASRVSEGFPRTIWEAMAHSLPVVATRVGSIPEFVGDSVVLAKPGNVNSITDSLRSLLKSSSLRRTLIANGLFLAAENTTERRVGEMICYLENYVSENKA